MSIHEQAARFARLPKWAQRTIIKLQGHVYAQEIEIEALAGDEDSSDMYWRTYIPDNGTHGLPKGAHVMFRLGRDKNIIEVSLTPAQRQQGKPSVEINSSIGSLVVRSRASNSITVETDR